MGAPSLTLIEYTVFRMVDSSAKYNRELNHLYDACLSLLNGGLT